jgi:hypothetical protein
MPRTNKSSLSNKQVSPSPSPVTPNSLPSTSHANTVATVQQSSVLPGLFSNIISGFGLGAGQSIAFNLFRPSSVSPIIENPKNKDFSQDYVQCVKDNRDEELCKKLFDKDDE